MFWSQLLSDCRVACSEVIARCLRNCAVGVALVSTVAMNPVAAQRKPNILVIFADDLRWDALSATGNTIATTDALDRIATEGVVFRNSYVTHSLCSPSRATLLTGLYTHQHLVLNNRHTLPDWAKTIPEMLMEQGYRTGFIGKWHMGYDSAAPKRPFSRWVSFVGQGVYWDPILNIDGEDIPSTGHVTDLLTEHALQFIQENRNSPFFLILSHKSVHAPYNQSNTEFRGIFNTRPVVYPESWYDDLSDRPDFLAALRFPTSESLSVRIRQYSETILPLNRSTGKIHSILDSLGLLDSTIVIMTSDNGFFLGEHGLRDKRLGYEESIRIPIIVRYPAWFVPGSSVTQFALLQDIPVTILKAAGISPESGMFGVSLKDLYDGMVQRDRFVVQYFFDPDVSQLPAFRALVMRDFKYIQYFDEFASEELYDRVSDPQERINLARDPSTQSLRAFLRLQMDSVRSAIGETTDSAGPTGEDYPERFRLFQNFPNPFNDRTVIRYTVDRTTYVSIRMYSVLGELIRVLEEGTRSPGVYQIDVDASGLSSGVYTYVMVGGEARVRKMALVR